MGHFESGRANDEITVPALFATTRLSCASFPATTVAGVTYVAPAIATPPLCHWYDGAGVPVATTRKMAI